eukprot:134401-Pyramimonas_sp.AAC.1
MRSVRGRLAEQMCKRPGGIVLGRKNKTKISWWKNNHLGRSSEMIEHGRDKVTRAGTRLRRAHSA